MASPWRSSTSRLRGRSRRLSRLSRARFQASCTLARFPFPAPPSSRIGADGAEISSTSSEQNGSYVLRLNGPGTYKVRASLAAFAPGVARSDPGGRRLQQPARPRAGPRVASTGGPSRCPSDASHDASDGFAGPFDRLRAGGQGLRPRLFDRLRTRRFPAARRRHQRDRGTGRQPRPTKTRRRPCAPSCSCLQDSRRMRRPRRWRLPASRGNRTTRCCLADAVAAANSARAGLTGSDVAVRRVLAGATRVVSAEAADEAAARAAGAPAGSAAGPAGSEACAAAGAFKATPTTTSAGRCSMPQLIRSTVACVRSLTTSSSATDPPSAAR